MTDTTKTSEQILSESTQNRLGAIENCMTDMKSVVGQLTSDQAIFKYQANQAQRVSEKLEAIVDRIVEKGDAEIYKTLDMLNVTEVKLERSLLAHKDAVMRDVAQQHQTLAASISSLREQMSSLSADQQAMQRWMWILMGTLATLSVVAQRILPSVGG